MMKTDWTASRHSVVTGKKRLVSRIMKNLSDLILLLLSTRQQTQICLGLYRPVWKLGIGVSETVTHYDTCLDDILLSCCLKTWKHPVIWRLSEANSKWSIWWCIWGNNICKTIHDYRLTWQFLRRLLSILGFVLPQNWLVRCDLSAIMCG